MGVEIERKFLISGDGWRGDAPVHFCQGYLNRSPQRTVRIRIQGEQAFLTVKGKSVGATRAEFEYPIPVADAKQMLELCEQPLIEKNRHFHNHAGKCWEVDEFLGANAGLVVAEVELESEDEAIDLPDWVGAEVTHDPRYFNSQLSIKPFSQW